MTPRYEFGGLPENSLVKLGAERERRRIAKTTGPIAKMLRLHGEGCDASSDGKWFEMLAEKLEDATKAPKKGRK